MNNKHKKPQNYLEIVCVLHGKSEKIICEALRSHYKIKLKIISSNNGKSSIQIDGVIDHISNHKPLNNRKDFESNFDDIKKSGKKYKDLKIYILMDTDDVSDANKKNRYIDGSLFSDHWASEYIVPIYFNPNLEAIMREIGVDINSKNKTIDYSKLVDDGDFIEKLCSSDELLEVLEKSENTNLDKLIKHCRNSADKRKIKHN